MSSGTPCSYQAHSAALDPGEWPRVCSGVPLSVRYLSGPWASSLGLTGMDKEKDMKRIIAHQSKVVSILAALLFTVGFGVLFASSVAWADANFHGTVTISLN